MLPGVTELRVTHVGGPTALIEIGGWRLLTDPTFDPPGDRYSFGLGTSSRKLTGPAVAASALPPIDAGVLSPDHHQGNLHPPRPAVLPSGGGVVPTRSRGGRPPRPRPPGDNPGPRGRGFAPSGGVGRPARLGGGATGRGRGGAGAGGDARVGGPGPADNRDPRHAVPPRPAAQSPGCRGRD